MMKPKGKMSVSYSILTAWERGNIEDVVNMVYHIKGGFTNEAMENGIRLHKKIEESDGVPFSLYPLHRGDKEVKVRMPINEYITFTGIADYYDTLNKVIYDWKSGVSDILAFKKMQLYCYSLLFPKAEKGVLVKIEEREDTIKTSDYAIYYFSEDKKNMAYEYIETLGMEVYNYIQTFNNFKPF